MGIVNEYTPACGWIKYHKRKALLDKVKTAGIVLGLLAAYCVAGYIEVGM